MAARVVLVALLAIAGCAAPPPGPPDPSVLPVDFSVDLTVVSGRAPAPGAPAEMQPGRYVVFPDGTLHHGTRGPQGAPPAGWLPPVTRYLDHEQVARLWALSVDLGLDPAAADPLVNLNEIEPRGDRTLYVLALTAEGRRWNFIRPAPDPDGPPVDRFVRAVAALAWVSDSYEPPAMIIPRRYDFGPDPYAQYRK